MLAAGLGASLANDLGFSTAFAEQGAEAIPLGPYASLVEFDAEHSRPQAAADPGREDRQG